VIALAVAFGLDISQEKQDAIRNLVLVLAPVLIAADAPDPPRTLEVDDHAAEGRNRDHPHAQPHADQRRSDGGGR
jgi:hypothetical protein